MKAKPYRNLTRNKRTSMQNLNKREDILITKAGKDGAVVIVDVKDYIKEAERLLTNIENYRKLQEDPTATNMKLVNDTIKRLKKQKLINKKVAESLNRNNPGHPVVCSVNRHIANISKYVYYHLQHIVKEILS